MTMLSCKEANRLMSQELDRKLSWSERFGLKLHVRMCEAVLTPESKWALFIMPANTHLG